MSIQVMPRIRPRAMIHIHYRTAGRYLAQMESAGLLTGQIRGKYHLFFNTDLITLLGKRQITMADSATPGLETTAVAR
jgi:hypothetical protein